jgi:hypothetical protein
MRILLALTAVLTVAGARADALPPDALTHANADFRAMYREAKARALASAGPVLLVEGDTLVLRDGAARKTVKFLPPGYTALKEASHVPLALFVLLHDAEGPLADPTRKALEALVSEVRRARPSLRARPFPKGTLARQEQVLDASVALVEGMIGRGAVAPGEVSGFARRIGPLLEANAEDAAALELEALQKQVEAWRAKLGSAWPRLHVVVMGSHMARTNEISLQYFERLLGEPDEGGRVVFAEGLWDEEKALDLLATHLLDGAASEAFFGNAVRLHEDMLAEGARKYLDAHPPK